MPASTAMATRAAIRVFMIILLVAFYALQCRQHYRPQRETSPHTMRVLHAGCARLREGTRLDVRASVMRSDDNSLTLSTRAAGYSWKCLTSRPGRRPATP
jgi:hypothetical protein